MRARMTGHPAENSDIALHRHRLEQVAATKHSGETGEALWRTLDIGDLRVRIVEYSPGYLADHWSTRPCVWGYARAANDASHHSGALLTVDMSRMKIRTLPFTDYGLESGRRDDASGVTGEAYGAADTAIARRAMVE